MAAPHVAGVAALMASVARNPPPADLRALLPQNAKPAPGPGWLGLVDALGLCRRVGGDELRRGAAPRRCACCVPRARSADAVWPTSSRSPSAAPPEPSAATASSPVAACGDLRPRGTPSHRPGEAARRDGEAREGRGAQPRGEEARERVGADPEGRKGQAPRERRRGLRTSGAAQRRRRCRRRPLAAARRPRRQISLSGSNAALPLVADLAFYYRRAVRHPPRFLAHRRRQPHRAERRGARHRRRRPDDPAALARRSRRAGAPAGSPRERCLHRHQPRQPDASRSTARRIQDLVSGRVTAWEHVAGAPITGADRPGRAGAVDGAAFGVRLDLRRPRHAARLRPTDIQHAQQVRSYVLGTPGAWGYVDFAFTRGLPRRPLRRCALRARDRSRPGSTPAGPRSRS